MACGSCGGGRSNTEPRYRWTSADGKQQVGNLTLNQAKTRQTRKGGSYTQQ